MKDNVIYYLIDLLSLFLKLNQTRKEAENIISLLKKRKKFILNLNENELNIFCKKIKNILLKPAKNYNQLNKNLRNIYFLIKNY